MKLFGFNCAGDVVLKFDDGEDGPDFETELMSPYDPTNDPRTAKICDALDDSLPTYYIPAGSSRDVIQGCVDYAMRRWSRFQVLFTRHWSEPAIRFENANAEQTTERC